MKTKEHSNWLRATSFGKKASQTGHRGFQNSTSKPCNCEFNALSLMFARHFKLSRHQFVCATLSELEWSSLVVHNDDSQPLVISADCATDRGGGGVRVKGGLSYLKLHSHGGCNSAGTPHQAECFCWWSSYLTIIWEKETTLLAFMKNASCRCIHKLLTYIYKLNITLKTLWGG